MSSRHQIHYFPRIDRHSKNDQFLLLYLDSTRQPVDPTSNGQISALFNDWPTISIAAGKIVQRPLVCLGISFLSKIAIFRNGTIFAF